MENYTYKVTHSFAKKLLAYVILGLSLVSMISGYFIYSHIYSAQLNDARRFQQELVKTNLVQTAVGVFANNSTIIEDVANGLLAAKLIEGVKVLSLDETLFQRSENLIAFDKVGRYTLYSTVENSKPIGYLEIIFDTQSVTQQARQTALRYTAIALFQTIFIVLVLIFILRNKLAKPLEKLANEIGRITPGSINRVEFHGNHPGDEIGVLTHCTNQFLQATEQALNEERLSREKLEQIKDQYKRIMDSTRIGFFVLNQNEQLINYNAALEKLFEDSVGLKLENDKEAFTEHFFSKPEYFWEAVLSAIKSRKSVSKELMLVNSQKQIIWVQCIISVVYKSDGELEFIEGVIFDITDKLQQLEQSKKLAETDSLTKLYNLNGFKHAFAKLLARVEEDGTLLVLFMLDLDDFKPINDDYGHAAGDVVLQSIAARIKREMHRASDTVARLGGDEFAVIFNMEKKTYREFASNLAERLLESISEPIDLPKHDVQVQVKVSIGISSFPDDGHSQEALLEAADKAMYLVKSRGKSGYAFSRQD